MAHYVEAAATKRLFLPSCFYPTALNHSIHEFSPAGFRGQGYGCELAPEDGKSGQVSRLLPLPKALGARLSNDLNFHASITEDALSVNWLSKNPALVHSSLVK